jgi:hypothetical protein
MVGFVDLTLLLIFVLNVCTLSGAAGSVVIKTDKVRGEIEFFQ